jgi:hypothetical protein
MSLSNVALCNRALTRLGAATISAMNEGSKESLACSQFFESSRDATLRDFKWNFATRRKSLALSTDVVAGFGYCYAYPSDCVAARFIYNPDSTTETIKYEVALGDDGVRVILTNKVNAVLIYTARVTNLSSCDPLFIEAFSWKLASEIALPITQDKSLMQVAETKYQNIINKARTADANEGESESVEVATWLEARLGFQSTLGVVDYS